MGLVLTSVHAFVNRAAIGAETRTPLNEIVHQIVIKRDQRLMTAVFRFKQNTLGARGPCYPPG
jgi:hypothetical protein